MVCWRMTGAWRRARFAVLRDATMPAILVEGGYMSHPAEGKKIFDAEYRKEMAQEIVKGILAYQKITAPPTPAPVKTNSPPAVQPATFKTNSLPLNTKTNSLLKTNLLSLTISSTNKVPSVSNADK
ncbi:MAG: N-acetylmuramoyl-L-alanine amidase [Limisphaerales bacterium]